MGNALEEKRSEQYQEGEWALGNKNRCPDSEGTREFKNYVVRLSKYTPPLFL